MKKYLPWHCLHYTIWGTWDGVWHCLYLSTSV